MLTSPYLIAFTKSGHLVLTEHERSQLSSISLYDLAIGRYIQLTATEIARLSKVLQTDLQLKGLIGPTIDPDCISVAKPASSSNSEKPANMSDIDPSNDFESNIQSAFLLLYNDRENIRHTLEQLRTLCKRAPDYAIRVIERWNTTLLREDGTRSSEIITMILTLEWELRGPSAFIECHNIGIGPEFQMIQHRLKISPEDFSVRDLHSLIQTQGVYCHPVRELARQALGNHVATFAQRLSSEPPGMSEDLNSLKKSITDYGFSSQLNEVLQKIDDDIQDSADSFDQTATMKHIRSFFEKLHESVGRELQRHKPKVGNGTPLHSFGQAIDYLERKDVITKELKDLAKCLYAILCSGNWGVHALKAERDYTRLCRNMVVEYAVTLFFELERRLAQPGDT